VVLTINLYQKAGGGFLATENILQEFADIDRIFDPKSIAIIGVSSEGPGFGRSIFISHRSIGYEGKLYPVNKRGGSIEGMKIYSSIEAIPDKIDFAIIAVPAHLVPSALEACRSKGVVGAEILSSGFSETGTPEGIALEEELKTIAKKGIRLIGPNCFGIYCPKSGLTMLPGPDLSRKPGSVALLSQSGGLSVDFGYIGKWRGIHFSKIISFGNGCDLRETEMLRYLRHDPETRVICMYIEGVSDGRDFFTALKEVAAEKPVIIIKGGLSESGSRAAASHTASLGGNKAIWEAALRQCHVTQVENLEEMSDVALTFSLLPPREYKGCAVMGGGGALGIAAADTAEPYGIKVPSLRKDLQEAILEVLPKPGSSATNPVDIANPYVSPKYIREILLYASQDENIDFHIVIQLLYHYKALQLNLGNVKLGEITPYKELAKVCREAMDIGKKPVMLILPNIRRDEDDLEIEKVNRETRRLFTEAGMPVFDSVKNAFNAVASISRYYRYRR
jgi:acyl-CoA synthetase (NDP forming)